MTWNLHQFLHKIFPDEPKVLSYLKGAQKIGKGVVENYITRSVQDIDEQEKTDTENIVDLDHELTE